MKDSIFWEKSTNKSICLFPAKIAIFGNVFTFLNKTLLKTAMLAGMMKNRNAENILLLVLAMFSNFGNVLKVLS